jgi:hypothetical protein
MLTIFDFDRRFHRGISFYSTILLDSYDLQFYEHYKKLRFCTKDEMFSKYAPISANFELPDTCILTYPVEGPEGLKLAKLLKPNIVIGTPDYLRFINVDMHITTQLERYIKDGALHLVPIVIYNDNKLIIDEDIIPKTLKEQFLKKSHNNSYIYRGSNASGSVNGERYDKSYNFHPDFLPYIWQYFLGNIISDYINNITQSVTHKHAKKLKILQQIKELQDTLIELDD